MKILILNKKNNFGAGSDKNTKGLFGHPVIVMNAENKGILGISSIEAWSRDGNELIPRSQRWRILTTHKVNNSR